MECRICGNEIPENGRFCPSCGNPIVSREESDAVLEEALSQAEQAFQTELKSSEVVSDVTPAAECQDTMIGAESGESIAKPRSPLDRLSDMHRSVKKGAEGAVQFGRKVGDGTGRAIQRTKEISGDVSQKVGRAVDKTKEISGDVAVTAKKVGDGVGRAVRKTKETVDELGQVGVIITQRALDVVRASLRAVEIVDAYLEERHSGYEVGNFITGVGIPPYLEIEFWKRSRDISVDERRIIETIRRAGFSCLDVEKALDEMKARGGSVEKQG
jgi:hypothetical protein